MLGASKPARWRVATGWVYCHTRLSAAYAIPTERGWQLKGRSWLLCPEADDGGEKKEKKKVVVNLGCGSDVLPWQCLTRYPKECGGGGGKQVKFVDVDFPDLIERKRRTVCETEELFGVFKGVKDIRGDTNVGGGVVFDSEEYAMIGCDLRDLNSLQKSLESVLGGDLREDCEFVFVAEVSITYMEREGADGVIKWASGLGNGEFLRIIFWGICWRKIVKS